MQHHILEFVHGLRRADIPVTLTETLDALKALRHVPVSERSLVRDALRTTLVKRQAHHREFNRLFALYFSHLERDIRPEGDGDLRDEDRVVSIPEMEDVLQGMGPAISALGGAILRGDGMAMEQVAMNAAQMAGVSSIRLPLQVGLYTRRMTEQLDWATLEAEIGEGIMALQAKGLPPDELRRLAALFQHNREAFSRMLRRLVTRELQKQMHPAQQRLMVDSLEGKSFAALSDREIQQMQEVVARLVQKLRTKIAILERKRRRGRLDIRRTLRKNLQYGGTPVELVFKEKKRKKTQVMALCDVSSSVWTASRFMLNLLYAIQDQFAKVRSFVFVSDLGEVTAFFDRYDTNEAIQKALKEAGINYFSYTDYGDVLLRFHETHLGDVNSRSVVIIIGDGRNNHLPSRAWVLEKVQERAKKVIWLNPEPRSTWGLGDSVMHEYIPYCTMVRECRNLRQLAKFIDELVV